jgi:hypothetical protein
MNAVKEKAKAIIKIIIRVLLFMYAEDYEKAPLDARDTAYGGGIRGFFSSFKFFYGYMCFTCDAIFDNRFRRIFFANA